MWKTQGYVFLPLLGSQALFRLIGMEAGQTQSTWLGLFSPGFNSETKQCSEKNSMVFFSSRDFIISTLFKSESLPEYSEVTLTQNETRIPD